MNHRRRIIAGAVLMLLATLSAASAEPKRVLLLNSFGRDFSPWSDVAREFRADLDRRSPQPVEVYDASLMSERFGPDQDEGPFVDYLLGLFSKRPLDLIVAVGAPAARFMQRHRSRLFPSTPMLLMGVEQRRLSATAVDANDIVVASSSDFSNVAHDILQVLPETTNIAVVIGNSPNEQYWREQIRESFRPYADRVSFTWYNDLSFDEMLRRVATLPPRSAIFFALLSVDAAGISHEEAKAFAKLRAVANAPIFTHHDVHFGKGIVGGSLVQLSDTAQQSASAALRVLAGEAPGDIKPAPLRRATTAKFDWRELQRWSINDSRLPPGSEINFRPPGIWEQYRLQVSAGLAVLILQSGMIFWLLIERRRRHLAEIEASERRREVVHLNRTATATVLSASVAHELSQPLGAILSNAQAAAILLKKVPPDLVEIGEIIADIREADLRAAEIIQQLRSLLKKGDEDPQISDVNNTVREVVSIAAPEAAKRGVRLMTVQMPEALPVRAGKIHLQQVVLNLVMNSIDALQSCEPGTRVVTIQTSRSVKSEAKVTVWDSGKGIPDDQLKNVFEAFFTTKPDGTGLGLPISRTIVESYGGTLRAENRVGGGTVFSVALALARR